MIIRALIVDDELAILRLLKNMLAKECPQVHVVATATNEKSARQILTTNSIDLVFLDVKLGSSNGFRLLESLDYIDFHIIFITAFDEYAVNAFRFCALDFLVKPIDPDKLIESVKRAEEAMYKESLQLRIQSLLKNQASNHKSKTIVLKTLEAFHVVKVSDIVECQAKGNYTIFHLNEKPDIITSQTLKTYDQLLSEYGFFRCHQSHLVNLDYITKYDKRQGGSLVLSNNTSVPVSPRKKERLFEMLEV